MEYCLGDGDGTATIWERGPDLDLDGDGRLDAVGLDFDGDGLADDALADLDGDGTWAVAVSPPRPGQPQLRWLGLDGVEHTGGPLVDFDGDGRAEDRLLDSDGDGLADRAISTGDNGVTGYVDTDGDGRWDVKLTDTDGDGTADAASALQPKP